MAEVYVKKAKTLLQKCALDKSDIHLALLNQWNTPRDNILGSPNQTLMSRMSRSVLPTTRAALYPSIITDVHDHISNLRRRQKYYVDRTSKKLQTFLKGETVRMQTGKNEWTGGRLLDKADC